MQTQSLQKSRGGKKCPILGPLQAHSGHQFPSPSLNLRAAPRPHSPPLSSHVMPEVVLAQPLCLTPQSF
jgi:hypothetical protein